MNILPLELWEMTFDSVSTDRVAGMLTINENDSGGDLYEILRQKLTTFQLTSYDMYLVSKNKLDFNIDPIGEFCRLYALNRCLVCNHEHSEWGLCTKCYWEVQDMTFFESENEYDTDTDNIDTATQIYTKIRGELLSISYDINVFTLKNKYKYIEIRSEFSDVCYWYDPDRPNDLIKIRESAPFYLGESILLRHWYYKFPDNIMSINEIDKYQYQ